jgi:hypothetical protein
MRLSAARFFNTGFVASGLSQNPSAVIFSSILASSALLLSRSKMTSEADQFLLCLIKDFIKIIVHLNWYPS